MMGRKRAVALSLALFLALGIPGALAAEPGSAGDPLVSLQYITGTYRAQLVSGGEARAEAAAPLGRTVSLARGDTVQLHLGGSCVLLSGSASLSIAAGTVIDVTEGTAVSAGSLQRNHRYLAAEDTSAIITATGTSRLLLQGDAETGSSSTTGFLDVPAGHWAADYVVRLADAELVNGMGDGLFSPDNPMTRGQFVTVLGRLAGIDPGRYGSSIFPDVSASAYYGPYVSWAQTSGIVSGMDDGKFYPNSNISREQIAAVVVRFAQSQDVGLPTADSTRFPDHDIIAQWARDAVYIARAAGLINGRAESGAFDPKGNASRAEVCAIVARLMDLM